MDILQGFPNGARLATSVRPIKAISRFGVSTGARSYSSPLVFPRTPWLLKPVFHGELLHTHVATATSMGRLILNVLLSFSQFEREVTGERIRDKIAASKKKGL